MRSYPIRGTVITATLAAVLAGCSSEPDPGDESPTPEASPTTTATGTPTPEPGAVAVSPDGVTTAVGAPADSTEEEYYHACYAARMWMEDRGDDPESQIEPYLAELQSTDAAGPSTFGTPWSELPPERQAAVLVAVQAAADQLCG